MFSLLIMLLKSHRAKMASQLQQNIYSGIELVRYNSFTSHHTKKCNSGKPKAPWIRHSHPVVLRQTKINSLNQRLLDLNFKAAISVNAKNKLKNYKICSIYCTKCRKLNSRYEGSGNILESYASNPDFSGCAISEHIRCLNDQNNLHNIQIDKNHNHYILDPLDDKDKTIKTVQKLNWHEHEQEANLLKHNTDTSDKENNKLIKERSRRSLKSISYALKRVPVVFTDLTDKHECMIVLFLSIGIIELLVIVYLFIRP